MEKRTSYAEFSSQLNDKNIVVLEFGRHYTRCGFAGEPAPRAIVRTSYKDESSGQNVYLHSILDKAQLQARLYQFIEKIYFNHLAVSPKEKKVVIVESVFCKSLFRNTLTLVFFEQFNVPSILFVPDHLMAMATLGCPTALVVDMGAEEVISMAIVDEVTLLDVSQFASLGAKTLDSLIYHELVRENPTLKDDLKPDVIEDIRLKACFVAPFQRGLKMAKDKFDQSKQMHLEAIQKADEENREISIGTMDDCYFLSREDDKSPATVEYYVNGYKPMKVPGNLREGACELFFEIYAHEHSLTTMIVETILSSPIDCRRSLAGNILVIGGLSNLPGLEKRLSDELSNMDNYGRFKKKIPTEFKFHKPICPRNYVSWLGASMFCTPNSIETRSTTRDQWVKDGKKSIRDWSDLVR